MMSLSDDNNLLILLTLLTLHPDIFNMNNNYFDKMVSQIYYSELQPKKANTSNTIVHS